MSEHVSLNVEEPTLPGNNRKSLKRVRLLAKPKFSILIDIECFVVAVLEPTVEMPKKSNNFRYFSGIYYILPCSARQQARREVD